VQLKNDNQYSKKSPPKKKNTFPGSSGTTPVHKSPTSYRRSRSVPTGEVQKMEEEQTYDNKQVNLPQMDLFSKYLETIPSKNVSDESSIASPRKFSSVLGSPRRQLVNSHPEKREITANDNVVIDINNEYYNHFTEIESNDHSEIKTVESSETETLKNSNKEKHKKYHKNPDSPHNGNKTDSNEGHEGIKKDSDNNIIRPSLSRKNHTKTLDMSPDSELRSPSKQKISHKNHNSKNEPHSDSKKLNLNTNTEQVKNSSGAKTTQINSENDFENEVKKELTKIQNMISEQSEWKPSK